MDTIDFLGKLGENIEVASREIKYFTDSAGNEYATFVRNIVGNNGTQQEIIEIMKENTATGTFLSTGMCLLSMEVPTALAIIGPALGIAVGAGVLSQTEPFQNVGTFIGEHLYAFLNKDGKIYWPESTIAAYAEKLDSINAFEQKSELSGFLKDAFTNAGAPFEVGLGGLIELEIRTWHGTYGQGRWGTLFETHTATSGGSCQISEIESTGSLNKQFIYTSPSPFKINTHRKFISDEYPEDNYERDEEISVESPSTFTIVVDGISHTFTWYYGILTVSAYEIDGSILLEVKSGVPKCLSSDYNYNSAQLNNMSWADVVSFIGACGNEIEDLEIQKNAVTPTIPLSIPSTYPSWTPYTPASPSELPDNFPTVYPIQYPELTPQTVPSTEPYQTPVQDPQPLTITDPTINIGTIVDPSPFVTPTPVPTPQPEPQPQPQPDPSPTPDPPIDPSQPVPSNPSPANPDPDPSAPDTPISQLTSAASKLFTVYNPSSSQLDSLGAYLWSTNIIDIVKSIWQNPMDGIISYFVLYATPEVGETRDIYLGALDSGVPAPVVSSQFIDVDCGEIQVKEFYNNYADYAPYTKLQLYLPFVGFVDLDVNDVMGKDDGGGYIHIKYRVDVYTGTCLAQVFIRRNADVSPEQLMYSYTGNCAQQIPLTGVTYQGLMQTLVGASSAFIGGGLGAAVITGATQFTGHEQTSLQRSGNMSANAGVLGPRKPFLIRSYNNVYYATDYASFDGYPSNNTVYLGNCSGFIRVKSCHLELPATENELDELEEILKGGIYI